MAESLEANEDVADGTTYEGCQAKIFELKQTAEQLTRGNEFNLEIWEISSREKI